MICFNKISVLAKAPSIGDSLLSIIVNKVKQVEASVLDWLMTCMMESRSAFKDSMKLNEKWSLNL